MAEFSKIVITKKGQSLIAKILAGGDGVEGVEFTNICASSAVLTVGELEELEVLTDIKQTSLISNKEITNATAIKVTTVILNSELTIGYYVRAIGLYAVDPDVGEILYGVTVETSGNCYMPPYNGVTVSGLYINLITSVGNAENVSLVIDPAAVATVGNIKELQEQIDMINVPNFTEATVRENIKTGDTLKVILGKIKKFFTDLKNVAFTGNYNDLSAKPELGTATALDVANNLTTTASGFVLDARQGKQLNSNITVVNEKFGGMRFGIDINGDYGYIKDGADTVYPFKSFPATVAFYSTLQGSYFTGGSKSCTLPAGKYMAVTIVSGQNCHSFSVSCSHGSALGSLISGDSMLNSYNINLTATTTVSLAATCKYFTDQKHLTYGFSQFIIYKI